MCVLFIGLNSCREKETHLLETLLLQHRATTAIYVNGEQCIACIGQLYKAVSNDTLWILPPSVEPYRANFGEQTYIDWLGTFKQLANDTFPFYILNYKNNHLQIQPAEKL
jgi:hypothetical protein